MAFFIPSNQNWSQQFFPFNSSTKKKNRVFLCFQRKARMYYVDLCKIVLRCNFLSQKSFGLELENVAPRFNINSKLIVITDFSSAPPRELNLYHSFVEPKQTVGFSSNQPHKASSLMAHEQAGRPTTARKRYERITCADICS